MLGIEPRAARATWTVLLIVLAVAVLYVVRRTILIFTLALLLAYLLAPLVDLTARISARRFPRVASLALVYVVLVAAVVSVGGALGARILDEAVQLAAKAPEWLRGQDLAARLPLPEWMQPWKAQVMEAGRQQLEASAKEAVPLLGKLGGQILSVIGNLGFVILIPILSFFFLKDGEGLRTRIVEQFASGPRRAFFDDLLSDVHVLLGQFMRALVILAIATFVFYAAFFAIIGVPYAALLAGLAAVLEFIPVLGPLVAAVVIVLVAAFSGHASLILWILAFLGGYRLFQDYVLQPYLMSAGVALHPLWIIFGVLAGEQIGGVAGMFLSIPVLATLRVAWVRIEKARAAAGS